MILRLFGFLAGAACAWFAAKVLPLGLGLALAGPLFGAVLLLTAVAAERFAPRPAPDRPRSASLQVRRIRDYLPRGVSFVATAGTASLLLLLGGTTKAGTPDWEGRPGRAIGRVCGDYLTSHSPWPGWYYAWPILLGTAICLVLALVALRLVTRRPRVGHDDASRFRASEIIVASYSIAVLTPLVGCGALAISGLGSTDCGTVPEALYLIPAAALLAAVLAWAFTAARLLFGGSKR